MCFVLQALMYVHWLIYNISRKFISTISVNVGKASCEMTLMLTTKQNKAKKYPQTAMSKTSYKWHLRSKHAKTALHATSKHRWQKVLIPRLLPRSTVGFNLYRSNTSIFVRTEPAGGAWHDTIHWERKRDCPFTG